MRLNDIVSDPQALLDLEPEELAGVVLQHLVSMNARDDRCNRYNYGLPHTVEGFSQEYQDRLSRALMEAWVWLEKEGMLAPDPGAQGEYFFITRRGKQLASPSKLEDYRRSARLPRQMLHPLIVQKVWSSYLRGDYDTAVFQAFKEIEVRVREIGKFSPENIGVDLMRKAFGPTGPLTDTAAPKAEQEALSNLFAGGIGCYKNPHSHRTIQIDADEAIEMVILASHLLRIADERAGGEAV